MGGLCTATRHSRADARVLVAYPMPEPGVAMSAVPTTPSTTAMLQRAVVGYSQPYGRALSTSSGVPSGSPSQSAPGNSVDKVSGRAVAAVSGVPHGSGDVARAAGAAHAPAEDGAAAAAAVAAGPKKTELKKKQESDGSVVRGADEPPVTTLLGEREDVLPTTTKAPAQSAMLANATKWLSTKAMWLTRKLLIDIPVIVGITTLDFFRLLLTGTVTCRDTL